MSKLRKIGRILLLVAGIFGLLDAVAGLFLALGSFVFGALCAVPEVSASFPEALQQFGLFIFIGVGVVLLFWAVFSLVAGILGIKAFKRHEKKLYIANIVFAVLIGFELLQLAGAILGLIALAKEKKEAPQEETPVAEAE